MSLSIVAAFVDSSLPAQDDLIQHEKNRWLMWHMSGVRLVGVRSLTLPSRQYDGCVLRRSSFDLYMICLKKGWSQIVIRRMNYFRNCHYHFVLMIRQGWKKSSSLWWWCGRLYNLRIEILWRWHSKVLFLCNNSIRRRRLFPEDPFIIQKLASFGVT